MQNLTQIERIHFYAEEELAREIYAKKSRGEELEKLDIDFLNLRRNCFFALITSCICLPFSMYSGFSMMKTSNARFQNLKLLRKKMVMFSAFTLLGINSMAYNLYFSKFHNSLDIKKLQRKYKIN